MESFWPHTAFLFISAAEAAGDFLNSIQFNFICIALNHHYSLEGLNRPNIYDPDPCPKRERKNVERNLEDERRVG